MVRGEGTHLHDPLLVADEAADIGEITNCGEFVKEAIAENKKLWYLAGPAIFTSVAQYSLGGITQVFAGHLTTLELDAVSTENMVIAGLAFGIMLGMGSALETLCGQAFGAKQLHMLGVYMQCSWIILTVCVFSYRQSTFWQPQSLDFLAKTKILQRYRGVTLLFHVFLSWLLISKLQFGLVGAAVSLNLSWWIVVLGHFAYIVMGYYPGAWAGFSSSAFHDLGAFACLSIALAIMLWLEFWYYMLLIVLAGRLQNAQVAVAAISICTNLNWWQVMIFLGFNAAIRKKAYRWKWHRWDERNTRDDKFCCRAQYNCRYLGYFNGLCEHCHGATYKSRR